MTTIIVRGLNDRAAELLRLRVARNGRSLEGEARSILERAARSDTDAKWKKFFAAIDKLDIATEPGEPLAEDLIRQDRDRGHREL